MKVCRAELNELDDGVAKGSRRHKYQLTVCSAKITLVSLQHMKETTAFVTRDRGIEPLLDLQFGAQQMLESPLGRLLFFPVPSQAYEGIASGSRLCDLDWSHRRRGTVAVGRRPNRGLYASP